MVIDIMLYVLEKLKTGAAKIDDRSVEALLSRILAASAVYVFGAGRSGLVARALAMRLMHLGLNVFVVGDSTTPAIQPNDLLLSISGSGETPSVRVVAEEAKKRGAQLASITATAASRLAELSDLVVLVPGHIERSGEEDYLARQVAGAHEPLTPLGTAFELTTMVFCDALVVALMQQLHRTESDMAAKHSTL
jgi:6-phospho-3-hexuloisomerase